jgi:hypothetical protein
MSYQDAMETTTSTFEKMSRIYRDDVENKIEALGEVSAVIHHHLVAMCNTWGYALSAGFRLKSRERIAEKDCKEYSRKSRMTQVEDIYAARICPSHSNGTLTDIEVKREIQNKVMHYFDKYPQYKCYVDNNTLTIDGRNIDKRCINFMGHIELQILTLDEFHKLEASHADNESRGAGITTSTSNTHLSSDRMSSGFDGASSSDSKIVSDLTDQMASWRKVSKVILK